MKNELIVLKQKPIIEYSKMEERGLEVAQQIAELNIDTIEPTEANRKILKDTRAELNKDLKIFEDQRKMIHGAINTEYNAFKDSYESNIKVQYEESVAKLKLKIDEVESKMLETKIADLQAYFASRSQHLEFLLFDSINLHITLSASNKSLKTQIDNCIDTVTKEIEAIEKMDHSVRIRSLYETTLDMSGSVSKVLADIEREEKLEAERIENERIAEEKRINDEKLKKEREEKEAANRAERKRIEAEQAEERRLLAEKNAKLNKSKEAQLEVERLKKAEEQARIDAEESNAATERLRLEREQVERKEAENNKIHSMPFTVHGTMDQLKQVKQFMEDQGISYE